jgi:2-keto-3-deoxy-L-rhamnonate aldolase RhmA
MQYAHLFREKVAAGTPLLGAAVTLTDPIVSEILCRAVDFIWIDAEHNPLNSKVVEGHLMAVDGRHCPVLVRVPMGDVNFVKHVLDAGADGIVAPQVGSVADARRMIHSCRYPPLGSRGFGPRRAVDYGDRGGRDYPQRANAEVLAFVMLEDVGALNELDEILDIPGLDGVVIGPADLSASLGHIGQIDHPEVQRAIDTIIHKTRTKGRILGVGGGDDVKTAQRWIARGAQWLQLGGDAGYLLSYTRRLVAAIRSGPE